MNHPRLRIKSNHLVLEIGSGHNPHPRTDVLCDRTLFDDTERQRQPIRIDRPFVVADAQRLPFKNNVFDFVYCAQVLEHSPEPIQFAKEIGRTGKRGLIVVPSIVRERLFGWSYHRWYFWKQKEKVYYAKKEPQETLLHAALTHRLFAKTLWFRRQINALEEKLNIYYFWKGRPRLTRATFPEKKTKLALADQKVKEIFSRLEFNWFKDFIFALKWYGERLQAKSNRAIKKEASP